MTTNLDISRRQMLAGTAAGLAACALPSALRAKAALSSITLGDYKITVLSDGHLNLPTTMIAPKAEAGARAAAMKAAGQTGERYRSPLNVTLLQKGKETILIDTGSGARFMNSAGKLAAALEGAGVAPDTVTQVILTHAHPDHLWGVINDFDEIAYPNAGYVVPEAEWNFWMAKDVLSKLPADRQGFGVGAQRHFKAIKDKIKTIKPGAEIISGITAIGTEGHTPGHVSIQITAGNDSLVVLGDALTHPIISFAHADWAPASDQDPARAVATRKKLLPMLVANRSRIIGYHLPVPGMGAVAAKGSAFAYVPQA